MRILQRNKTNFNLSKAEWRSQFYWYLVWNCPCRSVIWQQFVHGRWDIFQDTYNRADPWWHVGFQVIFHWCHKLTFTQVAPPEVGRRHKPRVNSYQWWHTKHCTVGPGCWTTLISNKSVPEHKKKNNNQKTGNQMVRCAAGEHQLLCILHSVQSPAQICCAFSWSWELW